MKLAITDVETTGLDALKHEVIQIAILVYDLDKHAVVQEYAAKVKPVRIEIAEPKALECNGYTPEGWKDALSGAEVAHVAAGLLRNAVFAGYNVEFDVGFVREFLRREGILRQPWQHRKLDVMAVAMPEWLLGRAENVKLATIAPMFGLTQKVPHDALDDVRTTLALAQKLIPGL